MSDLNELSARRKTIERRIRERERDLLGPHLGKRKCLSTTFPTNPEGTVETLPDEELPENYSKTELYQMVLHDENWKSLIGELRKIQLQFEDFLDDRGLTNAPYREQVIAIKQEVGHELSNYDLAKFLGCSPDYARKFSPSFTEAGSVREQRPLDSQVNDKVRQGVLERDGACVRCESNSELEVHHIIPVRQGGGASVENLAVLCDECHLEAHGDSWNGQLQYGSHEEFWAWVTES